MADLKERRRRWRGVALGGHLQRGAKFCFAANDGEASTSILGEWMRPGCQPTAIQMINGARALRSIGAKRVRREGLEWIYRLKDESSVERQIKLHGLNIGLAWSACSHAAAAGFKRDAT
jgi:hypothetical protein